MGQPLKSCAFPLRVKVPSNSAATKPNVLSWPRVPCRSWGPAASMGTTPQVPLVQMRASRTSPLGPPDRTGPPSWGLRFPSSAHEGRLTGSPQVPPCGAGLALTWRGCRALAHPPAPAPRSRPAAPGAADPFSSLGGNAHVPRTPGAVPPAFPPTCRRGLVAGTAPLPGRVIVPWAGRARAHTGGLALSARTRGPACPVTSRRRP